MWCLCSDETDSVQYHIDYAELYRYETNVIYPPMYAGTCQLSPVHSEEEMIGGDFQANIGGVEHYRKFGYKCKSVHYEQFCEQIDVMNGHNFTQASCRPRRPLQRTYVVQTG